MKSEAVFSIFFYQHMLCTVCPEVRAEACHYCLCADLCLINSSVFGAYVLKLQVAGCNLNGEI